MFLSECKGIIFEYTLNEVFEILEIDVDTILSSGIAKNEEIMNKIFGSVDYSTIFVGYNQLPFQNLFIYLLKRNARKSFFSTYHELIKGQLTDENLKEIQQRFYLFFNYSNMIYDRVLKEYTYFTQTINKLSGELKSTTDGISRFNDTPQEGGDFKDDEHTTTITTNQMTTTRDYATPAEMLDLTRRKLYNFIEEWVNSFDKFFWED